MSCPDCFTGHVHDGQPKGKIINQHGLDTYVSEPAEGRPVKGIIVIIPDAFGWDFVNNRLLADNYAHKGDFKVYLPDFMNGHGAPFIMFSYMQTVLSPGNPITRLLALLKAMSHFIPFLYHCWPSKTYPGVKGFFEQLRKEEGQIYSIGAAGFCWGGKHTITLAQGAEINGQPLIDAAFTGHPSFLKVPSDIEAIKRPTSFALAFKDSQISLKQAEQLKSVVEGKELAARGESKVYENTGHGFCVRADMNFKEIALQAAGAEDQCISWFHSHFKQPSK